MYKKMLIQWLNHSQSLVLLTTNPLKMAKYFFSDFECGKPIIHNF